MFNACWRRIAWCYLARYWLVPAFGRNLFFGSAFCQFFLRARATALLVVKHIYCADFDFFVFLASDVFAGYFLWARRGWIFIPVNLAIAFCAAYHYCSWIFIPASAKWLALAAIFAMANGLEPAS